MEVCDRVSQSLKQDQRRAELYERKRDRLERLNEALRQTLGHWGAAIAIALALILSGVVAGLNLPAGAVCRSELSPCTWARLRGVTSVVGEDANR